MNIKIAIIIIGLIVFNAAKAYILIEEEESKLKLSLLDKTSFNVENSVELDSFRNTDGINVSKDKSLFWIYHKKNNKPSTIKFFSTQDLSLINTFDITPSIENDFFIDGITQRPRNTHFMRLSEDNKKMMVLVNSKKKRTLNFYDIRTGDLTSSIPFKKGKIVAELSHGKDFIVAHHTAGAKKTIYLIDVQKEALVKEQETKAKKIRIVLGKNHYFIQIGIKQIIDRKTTRISYRLYVRNSKTGELISDPLLSPASSHLFYLHEDIPYSIIAYANEAGNLNILKLNANSTFEKLLNHDYKMQPLSIGMNKNFSHYYVSDKFNVLSGNISNTSLPLNFKLGFDIGGGHIDRKGKYGYFREGSGSKVAIVNLDSGEKLSESSTGRSIAKIGNVLENTLNFALTVGFSAITHLSSSHDTSMILDHEENRIFVVNYKTNDLTSFDAISLEGKKVKSTGEDTILVAQIDVNDNETKNDNAVFTLGLNKISFFNARTGDFISDYKVTEYLGFNFDDGLICFTYKKQLLIIDLKTGHVIKKHKDLFPERVVL